MPGRPNRRAGAVALARKAAQDKAAAKAKAAEQAGKPTPADDGRPLLEMAAEAQRLIVAAALDAARKHHEGTVRLTPGELYQIQRTLDGEVRRGEPIGTGKGRLGSRFLLERVAADAPRRDDDDRDADA